MMANAEDILPPQPWMDNYLLMHTLGEGVYGKVYCCRKLDTNELVAVKMLKLKQKTSGTVKKLREVAMLENLRSLNPNKCNIVRFYENFQMDCHDCLVFEMLDISLFSYMKQEHFSPMPLSNIRDIIKQLAKAFYSLKSIGVIHADLKLDNIMIVDHLRRPLRVKLIDFGLALQTSKAVQGSVHQARCYRSPEILLGLPFSEGIDMWSLGCVMAFLFNGCPLFPGESEYDVIRYITELLGQPADSLLNAGLRTKMFYKRNPFYVFFQRWRLMTPEEYAKETDVKPKDNRHYNFRSMDELRASILSVVNHTWVVKYKECLNLMTALLQVDASKRITPGEILAHPFITMSSLNESHHSSQNLEQSSSQFESNKSTSRTSESFSRISTHPQPTVILVQPEPVVDDIQNDGAKEEKCDSQVSTQAVVNNSSRQETADEDVCTLVSVTASDMAAAASSSTITEVGGPAVPAVDQGVVATSNPPRSSSATPVSSVNQAAPTHNNNNVADVQWTHTASEVSEPMKKKKKKKNRVRRFFSRLRAIFSCCTSKVQDVA